MSSHPPHSSGESQGHGHSGSHHGHASAHHAATHRTGPKRRYVIAVFLALLAMLIYILSLDDSIQPDGTVEPEVPAAPAL